MFIFVDRTVHTPVYLQIEGSIRKLIAQGALRPGEKLPSTRQLASELGVNRITIGAAFRKLEAEGIIRSHVGRGTFVNGGTIAPESPKPLDLLPDSESLARLWGPLLVDRRIASDSLPLLNARRGAKRISFVSAAPSSDLFPAGDFRRCMDFVLKKRISEISTLGSPDGLPSFKSYLVRWLASNGIQASEDEVIVTTGCQQSMDLIRRILIGPGDSLMMENPTYPGAFSALGPSPRERLELPVDHGRPDPRVFASIIGRSRCKLIYVVPNFRNPTGETMSLEARQQLVATSDKLRIPIVEDDVFGELHYNGPTMPTLKSLCPHLVIYIGSFSKMLTPALRLGWIVAPRPVARQLRAVKQASDLNTNLLLQSAMEEFCKRGLLHRHLKQVRRVFQKRRDAMAEALTRYFPSNAKWCAPNGGLSIWVSLAPEYNTENLLRLAEDIGVQFVPGSAFYFGSQFYNSLRLSFASESEKRIDEGVRVLGSLLANRKSRASLMNDLPERDVPNAIM